MSLTLLGLTDSNIISLCLSLHICKGCLILRKCLFSNSVLQCFVFSVQQCQQSELIPSSVNQATLSRDFQVLVVSASALLPATYVGAELGKIMGLKILFKCAVEKLMKANKEQK